MSPFSLFDKVFTYIYICVCVCVCVFQISISRRIGSLTIMVKAVFKIDEVKNKEEFTQLKEVTSW